VKRDDRNPFANWPYLDASPDGEPRVLVPLQQTERPMADRGIDNFLGGSPAAVFVRLFFVSLVVGALLMWLEIRPHDILRGIQNFFVRIYDLGFGAVQEVINYVLAGAAIVVPAWLILRLMSVGGRR